MNIVLPISLPLLYMLASRLVDMSPEARARAQLMRAVQDGQLGWVTMGFSASSTYDVISMMMDGKPHPAGLLAALLTVAICQLALAGYLAALGTLYPVNDALAGATSMRIWAAHYRLFVVTAVCTVLSGALFVVVHFLV